jgi:hypothetical protein
LTSAGNTFIGAVSLKEKNGGTWKVVEIVSISALTMGETTVAGDLSLKTMKDISQDGPIVVGGRTDIIAAGGVILADVANNFVGIVNVNTSSALELTTSGALRYLDLWWHAQGQQRWF